ncbi:MAG TPA: hypothetical protein PKW15_00570 [Alphaproteobacteria bacterium]|nr:hypothetical protein [Rhodospirillaceae bacterium]HRJ11716.1 hypothetical protein [Alphaproteobacteria bacterium]
MSGITSIVTPIFSSVVQGAVQGAQQRQSDLLSQQQLLQRQQQQEAEAAADAAAKSAQLQADADKSSRARANALSRGLAKARAYFAAQGIDPDSGSAAALAQSETADTAFENKSAQDELQNQLFNINRSLADLQGSNLLARTQLQQRQSFNRNIRF